MQLFAYLLLFLALSAALTWWRVASYRNQYHGVRIASPRGRRLR